MSESQLIALMHKVARESRKSIEQQCDEIYGPGMKSHWTYRKELNPAEEYARFPVEKLAAFCRTNANIEALELIADELGCNVTKRGQQINVQAGPSALISAVSRLMVLEENPATTRMEMAMAVNAVLNEAETIVYRRFPDQVAFSRSRPQEGRPSFWRRVFNFW